MLLGALAPAPAGAYASASPYDERQPCALGASDTACSCFTFRVSVPEPLRDAERVTFKAQSSQLARIAGNSQGELATSERAAGLLTLCTAVTGDGGIVDLADVRFRASSGAELVVPIFFVRASALEQGVARTPPAKPEPRAQRWAVAALPTVWSAGLESGLGMAALSGQTAGFDESRQGLVLAGFVDRTTKNPRLNLRAGLGFVQRGGRAGSGGSALPLSMNYLEMPLIARYRVPMTRQHALVPVVFAGPSLSLQLSCSVGASAPGNQSASKCTDDVDAGVPRKVDMSLTFGAGVQRTFGPVIVEVGARRVEGLLSIVAPIDVRNSGWIFSVGATSTLATIGKRLRPRTSAQPRGSEN